MADLRTDYLKDAQQILPFSRHALPRKPSDFASLIEAKAAQPQRRDALADALLAQYADVADAHHIRTEIERLREPTTFTVTTGHQLCLWGGPLFFTYKILSAIRLAEELRKEFPQHHFVPVFWMASEDHDAEEANHYHKGFGEKVTYTAPFAGAVGRHLITEAFFKTLPDGFEEGRSFFRIGERYATGFRRFAHHLFGHLGLVILDGDDAALKRIFAGPLTEELLRPFSHAAVVDTNAQLEQAGYGLQAHPRELNLFWLTDTVRQRIETQGNGRFTLADDGTDITAQVLDAIQHHPEHFSPNVILRPLYQEWILPNIAYIGGWGEFAYWMQLGKVFDKANTPFPAFLPRFSAHLLPQQAAEDLASQGLRPEDLLLPLHQLQDMIARKLWDHSATEAALAQLQASYDEVIASVEQLDPTLAKSFTGLQVENAHRGEHLLKKVRKSVRNRHPSAFAGPEALRQKWFASTPQERVLSLWSVPMPPQEFITWMHFRINPFETHTQWMLLP